MVNPLASENPLVSAKYRTVRARHLQRESVLRFKENRRPRGVYVRVVIDGLIAHAIKGLNRTRELTLAIPSQRSVNIISFHDAADNGDRLRSITGTGCVYAVDIGIRQRAFLRPLGRKKRSGLKGRFFSFLRRVLTCAKKGSEHFSSPALRSNLCNATKLFLNGLLGAARSHRALLIHGKGL